MTDLKNILKIEFWIQPAIIDHQINKDEEKFYFESFIETSSDFSEYDIDDILGDILISKAMNYLNVDYNYNFGVVKYVEVEFLPKSSQLNEVVQINGTTLDENLEKLKKDFEKSKNEYLKEVNKNDNIIEKDLEIENEKLSIENIKLEIKLLEKEIQKYNSKTEVEKTYNEFLDLLKNSKLTIDKWDINEEGVICFTHNGITLGKLDIDSLYSQFSNWKLNEDEISTISDSDGNDILEIRGSSFYNVGLADIKIYDGDLKPEDIGFLTPIKGGIFIRDNGSIQIGDINRTRSISFDLGHFLKIAKKSGTTDNLISEIKKLK